MVAEKWKAFCDATTRRYAAKQRAWARNRSHATAASRLADPATGGCFGLIHNWGNETARQVWHDHDREWEIRSAIFDKAYRESWEEAKAP